MIKLQKKKPAKYADRPSYPNIVDGYEGEFKAEFGNMLVKMSKQFGQKLSKIV